MIFTKPRTLADAFAAVNNHGPGFDTLRVVAASAVMYHHASVVDNPDIMHDGIFHFTQGYTQLGLIAVCIFFALSGFLVTPGLLKSGDVISYLSRRFMRIMPLLFVVVIGTAFVVGPLLSRLPLAEYLADPRPWEYLRNIATLLSTALPGIVNHAGKSSLNGALWTLHFEWLCYFVIAAASLTGILKRRWLFLALYVLVQAVALWRDGFIAADAEYPRYYLSVFLFAYFGAGTLLYLFRDKVLWSPLLMVVVAVLLLAGLHVGLGYLVAPVSVAYLVIGMGLVRFPWSALLAKADLSYGIYLMHSVILSILANIYHPASGLMFFFTCLPLACCAAWISWTTIEKPALRHKDLPANLARRVLQALRLPTGERSRA